MTTAQSVNSLGSQAQSTAHYSTTRRTTFGRSCGAIISIAFSDPSVLDSRTVEAVTAKYITPLPANADDEAAWVDRLLVVCQYLDDKPFKALMSLANLGEP